MNEARAVVILCRQFAFFKRDTGLAKPGRERGFRRAKGPIPRQRSTADGFAAAGKLGQADLRLAAKNAKTPKRLNFSSTAPPGFRLRAQTERKTAQLATYPLDPLNPLKLLKTKENTQADWGFFKRIE
jgi:hypothetical protein